MGEAGTPRGRTLATPLRRRKRDMSGAIDARGPDWQHRAMASDFRDAIAKGYAFSGEALTLGVALQEGQPVEGAAVRIPLAMMNRHGLVAGATGTGKTKTLQLLAEQLSAQGVPVFLADLKGDLSGIAAPGESNPKVLERAKSAGVSFTPAAFPADFVGLSGKNGVPLRATVSSFGPLLLARAFQLNETQQSVLAMVFKLCDDQKLLLLDLSDLKAVLQYLSGEGATQLANYGGLSKATVGVLLRKIVEMEQQGADVFFGEPEFDVHDLLRTDASGKGIVTLLELDDIQDKPALFSTFLMWLLASLYRELPEVGDVQKPKLVFFFDEAHFLFEDATKAFLSQVEQTVRMIRSKGVGVFFVTQNPKDVPDDVLAQLGNRVQHALRAFTPDDEKALKAAANTFPRSEFYDIPKTILSLGIGEALVTVLSERGTPTPVAATRMIPPSSLMAPIPDAERARRIAQSPLMAEYGKPVDRESAREMLEARAKGTDAEAPAKPATRGSGRGAEAEAPNMAKPWARRSTPRWGARSAASWCGGFSACWGSPPPRAGAVVSDPGPVYSQAVSATPGQVRIRTLSELDISGIVAIDERLTGVYRPDVWERRVGYYIRRDADACPVAEADGKVVGFMFSDVRGGEFGLEETSGWIERFGVDPDRQDPREA